MGRPAKYPWRTMEIGDTFLADPKFKTTPSFGGCVYHAFVRTDRHFTSRQIVKDGQKRVKVTRVR